MKNLPSFTLIEDSEDLPIRHQEIIPIIAGHVLLVAHQFLSNFIGPKRAIQRVCMLDGRCPLIGCLVFSSSAARVFLMLVSRWVADWFHH